MAIEVRARARNEETARWFRFSDAEAEEKADGFGLMNGSGGFNRWFAETFLLSRASASDPNGAFASGAARLAKDLASSVSAFGLLTTSDNTRRQQILAGRAYARIALTATALGIATHPMTQVTEEYADMAMHKKHFLEACGITNPECLQMVIRLGFASPHRHTARRDPRAMIRR